MINILFDSFARAGGIESGNDARIHEAMQKASKIDALPESPSESKTPSIVRKLDAGRPNRFFGILNTATNRTLI